MESSSKGKSLYYQLVDVLKERIETQMTPHDKLLSERELCQHYGVSRTTVRLALQELETQGYIYRRHGKGTFVSDLSDKSSDLAGAYSFTEEMRELGRVPNTVILEFKQMEANKKVAKNLNINLGETVFKLKRLRLADDEPLMVERSYLPAKLFIGLDLPLLESKPLYDVFSQDYEQQVQLADEEFYASIVQKKDADPLRIADGAPVLHLSRTTYNVKNEIIEYTDSVARADQFHYKIRHVRK
ncbi:GntR family transcriptional regulator [Enterococcus durans]|uniref:GntR family transcriptional regulator n=1 Tax=Enterococcus durans TaxID=53345 RepID=UPI0018828049|nr:GntR family transcriptional regulator [Enterococcus durans]MBE8848410.1 GntR family transcriptional regulator [Enterococcus durans]MBE9886278.1 GntR family transcriptional regulator [Enterococcus durans]MDB1652096.1 GntR family transcriptional regulator [Enterococcus durans]MDB1655607.1 GntR family transcriptional regulator [Enterococcus durans]MDB1663189.1 GntR family transcriptional regulator [Enterococcus durans]